MRLALAVLIPLLAFAVGYGLLRGEVASNKSNIERVYQRLDRIEDKIDALSRRP